MIYNLLLDIKWCINFRCSVVCVLYSSSVAVTLLAQVEWNISILDHMANLSTHSQAKQDDEIHQQDGPVNGNIKKGDQ